MPRQRYSRNQPRLPMPVPAAVEAHEKLARTSMRKLFSRVDEQTFATLKEALELVPSDNRFVQSATQALAALEGLYTASQQEEFTVADLNDKALLHLERHVALIRSAVHSLDESGALIGNKAAGEARQSIEHMEYQDNRFLKEIAKKEIARREGLAEGQGR